MQKAKQAAKEFLSGDGKHKTTIDQDARSGVTEEHVRPHRHENITTAVDKDVHQEHHQTRIQPITATETLPEKHTHNVLPVEHKTVHHGKDAHTHNTLEKDAAKYTDTSTTHDTTRTTQAQPTIAGERIHHHVHEHIQPVVEKNTISPEVVHTTVPIHETHHAAPVHHETTVLPAKTLEEFNTGAGRSGLGSKGAHVVGEYEGCPKPNKQSSDAQRLIHGGEGGFAAPRGENLAASGTGAGAGYGENLPGNTHEGRSHNGLRTAAAVGAGGVAAQETHKHNRGKLGRSNSSSSSSSDEDGNKVKNRHAGGKTTAGTIPTEGLGTSSAATQPRKSSLKDKLNPRKDADGDGKAGLFD